MNKLKSKDFACGKCEKIPKPGDEIYSCSGCDHKRYRCENCFLELEAEMETERGYFRKNWMEYVEDGHFHGDSHENMMTFDSTLTKLFAEYFSPHDGFCANSKYGCRKEFQPLKVHEKSCGYQVIPCPSLDCKDVISFKDVEDHMEQHHKEMLKANKEWKFEGTNEDEITCCLSGYDQKFYAQVEIRNPDKGDYRDEDNDDLYFKVIMVGHQANAIPFGIDMTFFLEGGKTISMKDHVYPITDVPSARDLDLSKVPLKKLRSRDSSLNGLEKINFCLKIVNDGWMDEIAKDLTEKDESGNNIVF